jgi:hypothetical protein
MPRTIPTIGRRIWYWPDADSTQLTIEDFNQAFDAGVIFVQPDGTVNLVVTDHTGDQEVLESVVITDEATPGCAQWMPYQEKQAAKQEAEELAATQQKSLR